MPTLDQPVNSLEAAISALEAQRALLGDTAVEVAVAALRQQRAGSRLEHVREGEFRLVTIMFAELSGCAALAERRGPGQARHLTNDCFEALVPVVEKYGGCVEKFVGDAIMAVFGAPVAHENDPERALRAALEMQKTLAGFNRERETDLGLHCGINTGQVVAGRIGSSERQHYGVTGSAVSVAVRLKGAAERGEILVGLETRRLAGPLFKFEPVVPIEIKGQTEPVHVYRLRGLTAGKQQRGNR